MTKFFINTVANVTYVQRKVQLGDGKVANQTVAELSSGILTLHGVHEGKDFGHHRPFTLDELAQIDSLLS